MEAIKKIAIEEIRNPTFGTTQQFLEVLKVKTENSIPVIQHIKINEADRDATVYFPVKNENFFLAIYVDLQDTIKIRSVETEVGSAVYLSIENIHGINSDLPLLPEKVYNDFKIYGIDIDQPDQVDSKIEKLLNYIEPHKETLAKIAETNDVTIHIAYYGYRDQMWGVHLDKALIKRIYELKAELDLDIYAEGKELYQ